MTLRVASHQPSFFPWLGYWNKAANADLLIFPCGVKFNASGYQHRVSLQGAWVTLPVLRATREMAIKDVRYDYAALPKLKERLLRTLSIKRNPGHELVRDVINDTFEGADDKGFLMDFNVDAYFVVADALGIKQQVVLDFEEPDPDLSKTRNFVNRLRRHAQGPVTYLAGLGQVDNYLDFGACPPDLRIEAQVLKDGLDQNTILQSIALSPDIAMDVREAATWKEIFRGKDYCGHRAAS